MIRICHVLVGIALVVPFAGGSPVEPSPSYPLAILLEGLELPQRIAVHYESGSCRCVTGWDQFRQET